MPQEFSPLQQLNQILVEELVRLDQVIEESIKSDVELVGKVASHIIKNGGKRIRPVLTIAAFHLALSTENADRRNQILKYLNPNQSGAHEVHRLAAAVELIHNATLLHDDVIDLSDMRRGEPSAHTLFGNTAAILVGDYLFSKSFQLMVSSKTEGVLDVLSKVAAQITEGEVLQLSHSFDVELSFENYIKIVTNKTAVLFEAAVHVGGMIGTQGKQIDLVSALQQYGLYLGLAFQVLDDIYDYFPPENFGKNPGDDLLEGKVTLPIILLLETLTDFDDITFVQNIFSRTRQNSDSLSNTDILQKICTLCIDHKIHENAFNIAKGFIDKSVAALDFFPSSEFKKLLQDLPNSLLKRPINIE